MAEVMRAIRYHQNGEADVLQIDEVPRPEPSEGEILVRVRSAGVNPVDSAIRRGSFGQATLPATPGRDLAGTVEAVGPGVTEFRPGQEVFGTGRGTYAEYVISTPPSLAAKPSNLSFDQAATVGVGGVTAWGGLFNLADLQPGQRLLVHGGAGGVGIYAVQLGKWKGAEVIGTASAANLDLVKQLGANQVLDYNATPFESVVEDADVVFASIGGDTLERSLAVLKPGGILVAISGRPPEENAAEQGVRVGRVGPTTAQADAMKRLGELLGQGKLRTIVREVFPFERAVDAMRLSETGHGRGHIVIKVAA